MLRTTIFVVLFCISIFVQASVYYVATDGDDAHSGTLSQPWKTLQKAADTMVAGDTVFVREGTYHERVFPQHSGTADAYIVYANYPGETVTIDGTGIEWAGSWNGLFDLYDNSYIQINGFRVINSHFGGIWIDNCTGIVIQNNYTFNTVSSGIGVWNSSFTTVANNEVVLACNDGPQESISIGNSHNCIVKNNQVHDNGPGTNGGEGIDVKEGSHDVEVFSNVVHHLNDRVGIYADAWDQHTYNIDIHDNIVHHCAETGIAVASEKGGLLENVHIYNNLSYFNKYGGIELGQWSDVGFSGEKPVHHIKIINNTCYKNGAYDDGWGFGILIDNPKAADIIIRNNICSQNNAQIAIQQIESGGVVDFNLFFGNNDADGTLYGSDSIIGDPLFVDESLFDFHLLSNSPAIDNGTSTDAPDHDFDGNDRPSGSGFDVGAYEYQTPLAVEYYSAFYAKYTGDAVLLTWTSAHEENNNHFEVERSKDGNHWMTIDIVNGQGNHFSPQPYRSLDKNPPQGKIYYRLKQVDYSARAFYSNIAGVYVEKMDVQCAPNPTTGTLHVQLSKTENAIIQISDLNGKIFQTKNVTGQTIDLDLHQLPAGIYVVRIFSKGQVWNKMVVLE